MYKVLVTGANGFIGSALCGELARRSLRHTRAVRTRREPEDIAVGDLGVGTDWSAALAGCDTVIHLAARVHVMQDKLANPLTAYREVNVAASLNLARQALEQGVRRFVFVSSVKVNGEQTSGRPYDAADVPAPQDAYGVSKLEGELALRELAATSGLELVIVRPPLVYGPGVKANFQRLMGLVRSGLPLPLGAIQNCRSMVALPNLVDFLILCARHPAAPGRCFLISDGQDLSIGQLIHLLAAAMGKPARLLPVPPSLLMRAAKLLGKSSAANRLLGSLQVDIGPARIVLGWQPPVAVEQGLAQTVFDFLARH